MGKATTVNAAKNIEREKNKYTLKWSLKNGKDITGYATRFSVFHKNKKGAWVKDIQKNKKVGKNAKSVSFTLSRNSFYPVKTDSTALCKKVRIAVKWIKAKSEGSWEYVDFKFSLPAKPTLDEISLATDTMTISTTLKTSDSAKANAERFQCRHQLIRETNQSGTVSSANVGGAIVEKGKVDSTEVSLSYKEQKTSLADGQYIRYIWKARSEGIYGNSDYATREYYIGWAYKAQIESVLVDQAKNKVNVKLKDGILDKNRPRINPTKEVQLQYVKTTSADVPSSSSLSWSDLNSPEAVTNGINCSVTDLKSGYSYGQHIWLRVKTTNDYSSMNSYSDPVEVKELFIPSSESSTSANVQVTSATAGADGESINCYLDWKSDTYNGTILGWSTDSEIWQSTSDPDTFELTDARWAKGTSTISGFADSAQIKVKGLDENTTYFFRARRYDTEDDSSKSGWSENVTTCRTGTTPVGVTLTAPAYIASGKSLTVAWVIGGEDAQSAWQLLDGSGSVIASGDDATTSYTIGADYLDGKDSITLQVAASTGGSFTTSNQCNVIIKEPPTITIADTTGVTNTGRTITTLPWSYDVTGKLGTQLAIVLTSRGVTSALPDDTQEQFDGDIIYSSSAILSGTANASGNVTNTLEIPASLLLVDGAQYTLSIVPTFDGLSGDSTSPEWSYQTPEDDDATTPVMMTIKTNDYTIDWTHKAIAPDTVTVTASSGLTATITPTAPTGAAEGDLCAIYRVTPDGVYLIADNVKFGSAVTDRWAPYGTAELAYRVATKTELQDYDWIDVSYTLAGKMLRLDWGANSVELPYNLSISDSWDKDYEGITYLDGTRQGYWNDGATHSASLSTDIIKVTDTDKARLLRDLAQYADSVFVRTPTGQAYEGNVTVSLDMSYDSGAVAISLDAEEIECSTFVCDTSDIVEPTTETESTGE